MNNWLSQLAPAHAPPPADWWPPAPGWWALAIILILIIATLSYRYRRPAARVRRAALAELKLLERASIDDTELARRLAHLLRRYAVAQFGRDKVASLAGNHWIAFIIEHGAKAWTADSGANLLRISYGGIGNAERARWLAGARSFFKGCR